MSHALAFDTHAYVKKLEKAGFNEKQAEAQTEALVGIIDENLATKLDIESLKKATKLDIESLRRDMKELEANLRRDMKELETDLKRDIEQIRAEMATKVELERATVSIIKWNVGAVFTAVGLFATIMKLLG